MQKLETKGYWHGNKQFTENTHNKRADLNLIAFLNIALQVLYSHVVSNL